MHRTRDQIWRHKFLSSKNTCVYFQDTSIAGYLNKNTLTVNIHPWYNNNSNNDDGVDKTLELKDSAEVGSNIYDINKSLHFIEKEFKALADRGVNNGVGSGNMRWIETDFLRGHIHNIGVDNYIINNISVITCGAKLFLLNSKPVIGMYNKCAFTGQNQMVHLYIQIKTL